MANENDRCFLTGLVVRGGLVGERLPFGVAVRRGIDAALVDLVGERVHAGGKYIGQAAEQVNMRARSRRRRARPESGEYHRSEKRERGKPSHPQRYPVRRASDSHTPPPIKTAPDTRPSSFARDGRMNQARPMPAAIAQAESDKAANIAVTEHMTASCSATGKVGSTNCG